MSTPAKSDAFEQAKQFFMNGLKNLSARRFVEAEAQFHASLQLAPGRISTLINLAAVRLELSRPDMALEAAAQVLAIEPANAQAWFHRGSAMTQLAQLDDALQSFEQAAELAPNVPEPWFRHGQVLQSLERDTLALRSYERAVAADPCFAPAWTNMGTLLREFERPDEAAQAFRKARENGGDDELHDYYLAAVGGGGVPAMAPALYVETLFDDYADAFAEHVVEVLNYRAHSTLAQTLKSLAPRRQFLRALDLGCGTGLCGILLKPIARHLSGVDLSSRMLAQARATQVYDALAQQDIVDFMQAGASTFDLVTAADVFIYVGDLSAAFRAVRQVLDNGGIFCFSAELASSEVTEFQLLPSLRYAHGERYLLTLASLHGFQVLHAERGPIRCDQRRPIEGLYMFLTSVACSRQP